jgi:uncharacterized membrane protein YhaH (DUF805 family)
MPLRTMLFSFDGRMRRSHWWAIRVVATVVLCVLIFLTVGVLAAVVPSPQSKEASGIALIVAGLPAFAAYLWVYLATSVKRLHDQDLSGWIVLLFFVPYVGGFAAFVVLGCLEGTKGPNKFGPSEKFPEAIADTFS